MDKIFGGEGMDDLQRDSYRGRGGRVHVYGERRDTVIDYVVENRKVKDRIVQLKIGDKVDSDH